MIGIKTSAQAPIMLFESPEQWEKWLKEHHGESSGVRLQIAKKGADKQTVSYAEALDIALCYGWIDGQKGALDDQFWLQKFTPRRSKSVWSKVNTKKATELIAQGRMQPAGLKEVEAAKQDGRWDAANESQRNSQMPEDFQVELENNPKAKEFFATLNSANRYAIYYRIQSAKKAETRRARIEKFIAMLNEQKKIYHQPASLRKRNKDVQSMDAKKTM
jgi:uncharacterized protein YdeI (YjbR/CyaY-like superfamily)